MKSTPTSLILRKIADAVDRMNATDIEKFADSLSFPVGLQTQKKRPHTNLDKVLLSKIMKDILGASTREIGRNILNKHDLIRTQLEHMARIEGIHVTKDDNVERIKEKIIESTIGSRLRSAAVRGE